MKGFLAALWFGWAIAGGAQAAANEPERPTELHAVTNGDLTAHFGGGEGEMSDGSAAPLELAVTAIWFTFAGDQQAYPFRPQGDFALGGRDFEVFSPRGDYVVLLQDRFGPYHIVGRDHLKAYLGNNAKADFVVSGQTLSPSNAGVHENVHWTSDTTVEFSFVCCATEQVLGFDIESRSLKVLRSREVTDAAKGPWVLPEK